MLAANPSRHSALVDSEGLGSQLLGAEMLHQALEDVVHAVPPYGNSHIVDYRNADLQGYGRARNTRRMEFKDRLKAARKHAQLNQAELAKASGLTQTSISDLERGKSKGTAFVAQLALACGVDSMWLAEGKGEMISGLLGEDAASMGASSSDIVREMLRKHGKGLSEEARQRIQAAAEDQMPAPAEHNNVITADLSLPGVIGDEIRIAHYEVEGAMGAGKVVHDYPEMLQDLRVSASHLRELGVTFEQPSHLKLMTGSGQSMEPTIRHLDPMIVNATVREFRGDAIYAFVWQSHFYVKRLAIADADHFTMISDNPVYPPVPIRMDETYIQAMVLIVWNARRV